MDTALEIDEKCKYIYYVGIYTLNETYFCAAMKFVEKMLLLMVALLLAGCGNEKTPQQSFSVVSGLPPVAWIAQEIGGKHQSAVSLLPEGRSPHDYAPGPTVLRRASAAKLFLSCGMPFEKSAEKSLKCQIVDVTRGIDRIMFDVSGNAHHHHHDGSSCSNDESDPHVWLSCDNACRIAENIADVFCTIDPANKKDYQSNLAGFKQRFELLKKQTAAKLSAYAGRAFFVYHPAFGYFAREYGLKQHSVELGGREVSAARLAEVIKNAKEQQVKVIFTQKEFNPRNSEVLAREIQGKCVEMDALAFNVEELIKQMADHLAAGFGGSAK